MAWQRIRIFRLANRSAIIPPHGPSRSDGMNCSATVMPTAVTEPESCSTSQSWAIRCIQRATTATKWPMAKMRKLGTLREMKVCRHGKAFTDDGDGLGLAEAAVAAESMTGWLTVADDGGGGATGVPQGSGPAGCLTLGWRTSDYVRLLVL